MIQSASKIWKAAVLLGLYVLPLVLIFSLPTSAQENQADTISMQVKEPGVSGMLRYGRWGPLQIILRPDPSLQSSISGTLLIKGEKGFRARRPWSISPDRKKLTYTIPVFCVTSFPVYHISLEDKNGNTLLKRQARVTRVQPPDQVVIGLSQSLPSGYLGKLREASRQKRHVTTVVARETALLEGAEWPGLIDHLYLRRSPDEPDDITASLHLFENGSPPPSLPESSEEIIQTVPIEKEAYKPFERYTWKPRKFSWLKNSSWIQFLLLAGFLFISFWKPERYLFWGTAILLPLALTGWVQWSQPARANLLTQKANVHIHRPGGNSYAESRVGLFPAESGSMRFPATPIKNTLPVFYTDSFMNDYFPELRWEKNGWYFYWDTFPKDGYFVIRNRTSLQDPVQNSSPLIWSSGKSELKNQGNSPLEHVLVSRRGTLFKTNRMAEGEIFKINKNTGTTTREKYLQAYGRRDIGSRTLKRLASYILDQIPPDRSFVLGVKPEHRISSSGERQTTSVEHGTLILFLLPAQSP